MGNSSRKIHGYRLGERVGGGRFGTVYKAKSLEDSSAYVVKEVYRGKSAISVEMLHREARIHEDLPYHRNIVRFIESFKRDYRMYIILEYCPLGTLNDYVVRNPGLSRKAKLYIMFDLARGLHHLHRHNIVHRDIKPENVLLSSGKFDVPTSQLCDFGLARVCGENGQLGPQVDMPASDDGPLMYMAPEITSGAYTVACDVFSLGLIYFVLYSRQTMQLKGRAVLEPHINGYPFFMACNETVKREITRHVPTLQEQDVISTMLRKVSDERHSVADVINKLQEIFSLASKTECVTAAT